jgi:hypothetical protein
MWIWWWFWLALIFVFLFLPLSWGWSQRDRGAPYPSYYRRRRYRGDAPAIGPGGDVAGDPGPRSGVGLATRPAPPQSSHWSWAVADLFWLALAAWVIWLVVLIA